MRTAIMLVLCLGSVATADMYANHVTDLRRGDTTVGDLQGFYGGTFPGTTPTNFPLPMTEAAAKAAVLGAPDTYFLSLPGAATAITDADLFPYTYVEVGFQQNFFATGLNLSITELGQSGDTARVWLWALNNQSITLDVTNSGYVDLTAYESFMNDNGGAFTRVGIGGLDLVGESSGYDVDAIGVVGITPVPVPSATILGVLGLWTAGHKLRRKRNEK